MTSHLTRVKARLAVHAHRKVRGLLEGSYAAVSIGRGIDFNDLREYVRGDDVKDIDWKASARGRQLLVKRYISERKHTIVLAVSTGRSMAAMNDADVTKRELSIFVSGMVGYFATQHSDLVSLVHGDAESQHTYPPAGGELHLERLLGAIHDSTTPQSPPTDLAAVLNYAKRAIRRRTIMLIVSDDPSLNEASIDALRRLRVQHEILFLTIGDLDPTSPPSRVADDPDVAASTGSSLSSDTGKSAGPTGPRSKKSRVALRRLVDIDTGKLIPDWLRDDATLSREFADLVAAERAQLGKQLDRLGIVHERINDWDSAIAAVFRLLERHRYGRR